jgi:hypothetical protein
VRSHERREAPRRHSRRSAPSALEHATQTKGANNMRIFKMIGALVAVLAFGAFAIATTASGAETLWKWLPGSAGETFKGEQPETGALVTEPNHNKITCAKAKILLTDELPDKTKPMSELLKEGSTEGKDATLELVMIHFEGCRALGIFPANSLGDPSEVILAHLEVHNCMIKKGEFGLLILPLALHIEIPSLGLLITILEEGLFIAKIEAETKLNYKLTAKQTEGLQEIKKCEGGQEELLLAKVDNEPEEHAALETKTKLEFDMTKDKEGEEMMEK